MPVTYKVQRSLTGLTEDELNTLGAANWLLSVVLEEDIGYQYIFRDSGVAVGYRVIFAVTGLTEAQIQMQGDDDFSLIAVVPKGLGFQYIFWIEEGGV